jgi:GT2 family glycosyltransferase
MSQSMKRPNQRSQPLVSVVIPVFNKCELTVQCLDAIARVGARVPFEVIVVDDASSDATPQHLAQRAGQVRAIRNPANRGFGGSCNLGAAAAAGRYVLFLNNDTIPLPGWLDGLADELQTRPEVVVVGSKLLYEDGLVQHAGIIFERGTRNLYHPYRLLRADDPRVNRRRELQAVTGACLMIRARSFKECGGFHERFQTGYEDVDLCLTVRRRGGLVVYQPKSALIHLESQTPGRMRHEAENWALFHHRWADQLLSDEDDYYFGDGLRIQRHRDVHGDVARCVRFVSPEERARWAVVAECQRAAAAGKPEQMRRCLERSEAWPEEADLRRWAWVLSGRLGLRDAARAHLLAAADLAPTPELVARLALDGPDGTARTEPARGGWQPELVEGFQRLRDGDPTGARDALEAALRHGAPPHWALRGLWESARAAGDAKETAAVRAALLRMRRADPETTRRLALELPAAERVALPEAA